MNIREFSIFFVAWLIASFVGMPIVLALIVIWKGLFGNFYESVLWGLTIGILLGIIIWPLAPLWIIAMTATSIMLYLSHRYVFLKVTPFIITLLTFLSFLIWHILVAVVTSSQIIFLPFFSSFFLNAFAASITITLYYAIVFQKKSAHQARLWERPPRGIVRTLRQYRKQEF